MKLVVVIHGLPMGGAEKFLIGLLNYLRKNKFDSHLILLGSDDELQKELHPEIPIYKILKTWRFDFSIVARLKKKINSISPNCIMCINTYSFFLTKLATYFTHEYPIVLSPHSTKPFSIYNFLQNLLYYRFISRSDFVIYLCNAQKEYLNKVYRLSSHKKFVNYNGIDISYFNSSNTSNDDVIDLKKQLGISEKHKLIVQVARIQPEKRHDVSIKALSKLNMHIKNNVHLLLVGGGSQKRISNLKSLASQLGVENHVHFLGAQSDVRLFYKSAHLFTLTSESETFSLAALEAMAVGLPVVLTDVGGAREMITENINGYLVPVSNSLCLAQTWEKALSICFNSASIREVVKNKFNQDTMFTSYAKLLTQIGIPSVN